MDKHLAANILCELEVLFNSHPPEDFPALTLLYNGLRKQAAQGDLGVVDSYLQQVCQVAAHALINI